MTVELVRPFAAIKAMSSDVNTVRVFRSYDGRGSRIETIEEI